VNESFKDSLSPPFFKASFFFSSYRREVRSRSGRLGFFSPPPFFRDSFFPPEESCVSRHVCRPPFLLFSFSRPDRRWLFPPIVSIIPAAVFFFFPSEGHGPLFRSRPYPFRFMRSLLMSLFFLVIPQKEVEGSSPFF